MYVFQASDGPWWIAHYTNTLTSKPIFGSVADGLYRRAYATERQARAAMAEIYRLLPTEGMNG